MANTGLDWSTYVSVKNGVAKIRSNLGVDWREATRFTIDEAEDMANHVLAEVEKARRNDPEIQELANDIALTSGQNAVSQAIALHQKGYRKQ